MKYETRFTGVTFAPSAERVLYVLEPIFSNSATRISIEDTADGEFII